MSLWLLWLVRALTVIWAGFWLWFGVASAVLERQPWHGVVLYALRPGLMFVAIVVIAWLWPRPGGVVLIVTSFLLAAWYGIYYGDKPTALKVFVLATIALPPLLAGLILLWFSPGTRRGVPSHQAA